MDPHELALRREIMAAFAATGEPPAVEEGPALRGLVERHAVVLGDDGQVVMAHPFAGHRRGAQVQAGGRSWWGSCSWDAFGLVAALGLQEALVTDASGLQVAITGGEPAGDAVFHVALPAREWWADIGFT